LERVIDRAAIGVLAVIKPHQTDADVNNAASKTEARIHELLATPDGGQSVVTVAAAESLTGGNVAARITTIAGSSSYFLGSIVAYSNEAKASLLGVSQETLDTRGAVSAECAREMAEGARRAFGADLAVATTGIAGPGGATERKVVGLVYVGLAGPEGVSCEEFHFPGGRAVVTDASTEAALLMLLRGLERRLGKE
jgi:nicotinamide-nucleotide amidase